MEGPYTRYPRTTLWLVEGDVFTMGGEDDDAKPHFEIEIPSLYIGKSLITNEEYEVYDSQHARATTSSGDDEPAVGVSFRDAVGYCRWYSEATGKRFRLPSEAQWEFVCRSGTRGRAFWGDDVGRADAHAWSAENSDGRCRPIESKRANPFGVHDMLGLAWEWTSSLYRPYPITDQDGRDDEDVVSDRAARGGSFREPRAALRCGGRRALAEDERRDDLGFRIVRLL